ncbi:MAG: hypothetical protein A2Z99_16570 [Treponema sp. GWB1_62_6]|nr:MAG: hypothetical protein A2Z99_16570 [Treponema sp. GWB1_62_6]
MSFDRARFLFALILLVPPLLYLPRRFNRRLSGLLRLVGRSASAERDEIVRDLRLRHTLSSLFFMLSFAALIVALAGPRWSERLATEYRRGLDVAIALDLSRSMDAGDGTPTRMASAVALARATVQACPSVRFAVALGKGAGFLAVPLTDDDESVLSLLSSVSSSSLTSAGTDLERLLDAATSSFPPSSPARKLVVILSDGEALSGSLPAAVDRASESGAIIASVAFGSTEGSPLAPAPNGALPGGASSEGASSEGASSEGASSGGAGIVSSRREQPLRDAAARTGGIFLDGDSRDAADRLVAFIGSLSSGGTVAGSRRESVSRRAEFIVLALLLFGASKFAESGPRRKP